MVSLLVESWVWFSFVTLIVLIRYISRWQQLGGIKRYQPEDYTMLGVFGFYTTLVTCMNIVAHLDTNLMTADEIPLLTPASIASRTRGSKLVLVVEQSMIMTIWGCKICLLLFYLKLTQGLKQQLAVKIVGVYVVASLILMEILSFGVWCRPFSQYWAVPVTNIQCSTGQHHLIVNAVFNISSDIMMICIALPLLIASHMPRTQKLIVCCLFSLGIFVIISAVLNKYYSFAHPFSPMWTFWYIREASTAMLVANIPMCWPLFRNVFNLRSMKNSTLTGGTPRTRGRTNMVKLSSGERRRGAESSNKPSSFPTKKGGGEWWELEESDDRMGNNASEEELIAFPAPAKTPGLAIYESKEFFVKDEGEIRVKPKLGAVFGELGDVEKDFKTKTVVSAGL